MKKYLNYQEASDYLSIKRSTLYSMVCRRQIPFFRVQGRMVRFRVEHLEEWMSHKLVMPLPTTDRGRVAA